MNKDALDEFGAIADRGILRGWTIERLQDELHRRHGVDVPSSRYFRDKGKYKELLVELIIKARQGLL